MNYKKTVACVLISGMLLSSGCSFDNSKDIEAIRSIPEQFIEAIANDDCDTIGDLSSNFNFERFACGCREYYPETYSIMLYAAGLSEITECSDPVIDKKNGTAEMDITVSYIDIEDFSASLDSSYMTYDEVIEAVDNYSEREEEELSLDFKYDEDEQVWILGKTSARHIAELYVSNQFMRAVPSIVEVSPAQALEYVEQAISDLASNGISDIISYFNLEDWQLYDNILEHSTSAEVLEAVQEFIATYVEYITSHDYTLESDDNPYYMILSGSAPSREDLYQAFFTDEFRSQYFQNMCRGMFGLVTEDEYWESQSLLVYNTLVEAIPNCRPEDYSLTFNTDAFSDGNSPVSIIGDLILSPERGYFEFDHSFTLEETIEYCAHALNDIYAQHEITLTQLEHYMSNLASAIYAASGATDNAPEESPSGHPNQAVGVSEQVPNWCDDGSIIYGYSTVDENGFWMMYTKESGWLNSVGYCIDDTGIWITSYFDREFNEGDVLICDWWVDGELVLDSIEVLIAQDGTTDVEVYLPRSSVSTNSTYEMRLWEDDHSHVISYVTLQG